MTASRSLFAVMAEGLRPDCKEPGAFVVITLQALAQIDKSTKQERPLFKAQTGLYDEAAEFDFLARVFFAGFRLR
jgi:hypothetical protein